MAINLHKKYETKLAEIYTHNSFVEGHTNKDWSFSGVKSILIPTLVTQPLNDYQRSGTSRYGTPTDLQDTAQEMTMTQDKGFAIVIDKGDNSEQQMMKSAGHAMKRQISEQVVPVIDKYALKRWVENAGKAEAATAAPSKSTTVSMLLEAEVWLNDHFVPESDRWCYIPNKYIKYLRTSDEFSGCDGIVNNMLVKGYYGNFSTFKIVGIPESYLPANVYFMVAHKGSVILAQKIRDTKIHQDPPGISGHLLEGRYNYDAFVVGERSSGVYVSAATASICATPTITITSHSATIATTTSGATVKYTLDGTDPRYSTTALTYTAAVTTTAGVVVKAAAVKDGLAASAVAEKADA